ncbi:DUF1800 domain-containing protein [Paracidovorax avenae]|uniref:DUF1800 domain-containing protein n=1 Tax=Paracidovorax avenae TaxID=80867 RepID=UPI000D1576D9|nr:DUF1800 domain-containing protein [Paracidovorax avenae]AVS85380.1 DUF1800 domain-containing protein [Paracidovorax avenae]AVT10008.1 DUF1800 domain-containing protein [Paracidovorax avenae]AVT20839.1 DUF1800 domain-containing protein [Paracidovorax avenae]
MLSFVNAAAARAASLRGPEVPEPGHPTIGRRQWLATAAVGLCGAAGLTLAAPPGAFAAESDRDAPRSPAEGARLLDRLTWGANATALEGLQRVGPAATVAALLRPAPNAPLPPEAQAQIDAMAITRTPMETLAIDMQARQQAIKNEPTEDARKAAQDAYQRDMRALQREAERRFVLRAVYSPAQLQEKMTWFWMNHFNVFAGKADIRAMVGDYEDRAIRPHALGRFRDLLGATVRHPAMLRYLDNAQNASRRINENYARELMELHTLGVDGGYSQHDVQEMARVLTGHGVSLRPLDEPPPKLKPEWARQYVRRGLYEFHPQRHDWDPKELLGQPLQGQGMAELDEALDRLARAPATARFVTRKMAAYLVGDAPPPALLQAMAERFQQTDGHIGAVLQTLFTSESFQASLGTRLRDPVQYVMAGLRLGYSDRVLANPDPALSWLQRLAEPLYGRVTPDGYPLDAAAWTSSGQMAVRFEIARALGGAGTGALYRTEGAPPPKVQPPAIAQNAAFRAMEPQLAPATRVALARAGSPAEWNTFLLSAPEFMYA